MLWYDCAKHLVSNPLFKRNVAALLPKHAKAGALEGANEAFARNAGSRVMLFCDFDKELVITIYGETSGRRNR
jgi:hypothetical protein